MIKTLVRVFILLMLASSMARAEYQQISVQLQWLHQFQFAGFYVARELGFYADEGLEVEIKASSPGVNVVDEILENRAHFGVGRSSVIVDRAAGKPVVVLGAILQNSALVLITTNPEVRSVRDLRGKRAMITTNAVTTAPLTAMLLSQGVLIEDLEVQQHSFRVEDLVKRNTDTMAAYLSNQPFHLEQAGVEYRVFDPGDYGFDFYGDLIITSERQIQSYPDRTRKFYDATIKGWKWAFNNIEATAQIIHDHYNDQGKSLESLIFEGRSLASRARDEDGNIGRVELDKMLEIERLYRLSGKLAGDIDWRRFLDPLGFNRHPVRIGVMAEFGLAQVRDRWQPLADYLNHELDRYHVEILPILPADLPQDLSDQSVDFLLTDSMNYVQLEQKHALARMATLKHRQVNNAKSLTHYGSVIFSRKSKSAQSIRAIDSSRFAAVSESSFAGWVIAHDMLISGGIDRDDIDLQFYGSNEAVVAAVLEGKADFGTVQTGTLEYLDARDEIDLQDLSVVSPRRHDSFPYLASSPLYPEWLLASLDTVSDSMASAILSALIKMPASSREARAADIAGWTVPQDDRAVHDLLKRLKMPPYDQTNVTLGDVIEAYSTWILLALVALSIFVIRFIGIKAMNTRLDSMVRERTVDLTRANALLEELAHKDALTDILNRGHFMELASHHFQVALRNKTALQVLAMDIDNFKQINDRYSHQTGDEIIKLLCDTVSPMLRSSDLFGRIGGEEFAICLQNTSRYGAIKFANRVLEKVRKAIHTNQENHGVRFSVSIGLAGLDGDDDFAGLLHRSDLALYKAKELGRDRLELS